MTAAASSWVAPALGRFPRISPVVVAAIAVVPPAVLAARSAFDGLYGQDAFAYYDYASGPLRQSLLALHAPPPFYWPPGYPILVVVASLAVGLRPLAGQIVSLVAAALVPFCTILLAREMHGTKWAPGGSWSVSLLAGLITACCGQLWQSGIVVMADTTALAAATLGAWMLARYLGGTDRSPSVQPFGGVVPLRDRRRYGRWRSTSGATLLALAAFALAWATTTRWIYGLVAVPLALTALVALVRRPRSIALRDGLLAAAVASLVLAPVVLPFLTGESGPGGNAPAFATDFAVYSWDPLNALRREFITADGRLSYALPNGVYYARLAASPIMLTPLLAVLVPLGLWHTLRRPTLTGLMLVGWLLVVYAFHAGAPWQNVRFALAYLPPLAILAAVGAAEGQQLLGGAALRLVGRETAATSAAACVGLLVALGLAWQVAAGATLTQAFLERKQADLATVDWVDAQTPPTARILAFGLTLTLQHYGQRETLDVFDVPASSLPGLLADDRPGYLLIDVAGVESQWQGRTPADDYAWLKTGPGLVPLGQHGAFTLFRVGGT